VEMVRTGAVMRSVRRPLVGSPGLEPAWRLEDDGWVEAIQRELAGGARKVGGGAGGTAVRKGVC